MSRCNAPLASRDAKPLAFALVEALRRALWQSLSTGGNSQPAALPAGRPPASAFGHTRPGTRARLNAHSFSSCGSLQVKAGEGHDHLALVNPAQSSYAQTPLVVNERPLSTISSVSGYGDELGD